MRRKIEKHVDQTEPNDLHSFVEKYPKEEGYLLELVLRYDHDGEPHPQVRVYKMEEESNIRYKNRISGECRNIIREKIETIEKEIIQSAKSGNSIDKLAQKLKDLEETPIPKNIKELEECLKKLSAFS